MLGYHLPPVLFTGADGREPYATTLTKPFAWAHLLSGGSAANMEAPWLARLVTYLPIRVRAAAKQLGLTVPVVHSGRDYASIAAADDSTRLALHPSEAFVTLTALESAVHDRQTGKATERGEAPVRVVSKLLADRRAAHAVRKAMRKRQPIVLAPARLTTASSSARRAGPAP